MAFRVRVAGVTTSRTLQPARFAVAVSVSVQNVRSVASQASSEMAKAVPAT